MPMETQESAILNTGQWVYVIELNVMSGMST